VWPIWAVVASRPRSEPSAPAPELPVHVMQQCAVSVGGTRRTWVSPDSLRPIAGYTYVACRALLLELKCFKQYFFPTCCSEHVRRCRCAHAFESAAARNCRRTRVRTHTSKLHAQHLHDGRPICSASRAALEAMTCTLGVHMHVGISIATAPVRTGYSSD